MSDEVIVLCVVMITITIAVVKALSVIRDTLVQQEPPTVIKFKKGDAPAQWSTTVKEYQQLATHQCHDPVCRGKEREHPCHNLACLAPGHSCHDTRCPRRGLHGCHDLDCHT